MNNKNNIFVKNIFLVLGLLIVIPAYAFDMDQAITIYGNDISVDKEQNINSQQTPQQQHTREYYQQKWLENQSQPKQVSMSRDNNKSLKSTPESDDLFLAATNGNNGQIGDLLSQGLDINVSNVERETALHMAAARGHYSTVIFLIQNGAYINARTVKNWIPLHHAVRFRHHNIANYLIKRGSSAGVRTSDGLSSIDMARNVNDYRLLSILGAR